MGRVKIQRGVFVFLALLSVSCRSTYPRPAFAAPPGNLSSGSVLRGFRSEWPESGTVRHSAVLDFRGIRVPALGMSSFDSARGDAALAMFSTTGMKILQVESRGGRLGWDFRLNGIKEQKKAAENLIGDVKGIFIHPPGPADYRVFRGSGLVLGWRDSSGGLVELVFGVPVNSVDGKARLMEKFSFKDGRIERSVFYYEYPGGSALPSRIRMENYRSGYNLTLKSIP